MNNVQRTFEKFINDDEAGEMYITGVAGTGKTSELNELMLYCDEHTLPCVAVAFTHKACGVLRSKLHKKAQVQTLHAFLKKCPTVNSAALKKEHVDGNAQVAEPERPKVLFIDEFSMVGERDFVDISDLQYDEEGNLVTKVVYIGDPNQLPPVRDSKAVEPSGNYWVKLTTIHRQSAGNPLIDTLLALNDYINGAEPKPLEEHAALKRGVDIVDLYKVSSRSKVILAYTNAQVECLNAEIQGRTVPLPGDMLFSPTLRKMGHMADMERKSEAIVGIRGDLLEMGSKYKTLETLHEIPEVRFFLLEDEEGDIMPRAAVFGHDRYLQTQQRLAKRAVFVNQEIKSKHGIDPKEWSRDNWKTDLAQARRKAWAQYLAFKDYVVCLDFAHAMTVHKSQGSTYEDVFLDIEDMARCIKSDYTMYLKLLYVAVSRASKRVYTN